MPLFLGSEREVDHLLTVVTRIEGTQRFRILLFSQGSAVLAFSTKRKLIYQASK